ncbi:MAG: ATP-binding protein [Bacteroidales bacterium]|nr:ATP-binding protein [Bacteroidales bacterium]
MQLKKLYIKDYKILKDFTLEFPFDSKKYISVFIGANGSGKSTIFEAIAKIFDWVLLDKEAEFVFELEYSLKHEEVLEETSTWSEVNTTHVLVKIRSNKVGDKLKILINLPDNKTAYSLHQLKYLPQAKTLHSLKPSSTNFYDIIVPDRIIIYYAGLSEILKSVTEPHIRKLSEEYRKGKSISMNPFFYFESVHFNMILVSLLSYEFGDIPNFLNEKGNIVDFENIQIFIKKPYWANDSIQNFWGAKGEVRNFLDYLDSISGDTESLINPPANGSGNIIIEVFQDESIIISILGRSKLFEIREHYTEERKLFELLNILYVDDLLEKIEVSLIKSDIEFFEHLSEGEKQAITIKGLTELLGGRNTLFLFDEPDTYLHPLWQYSFISEIEKSIQETYEDENSFLIATHSPQILSNAHPEFTSVRILEEGKLVERTPKHFGKDIASILFQHMGVEERNKTIQKQISNLYTLIEDEELEAAQKELARLKEILGDDDTEVLKAQIQIDYLKEDEED